MGIFILIIVVLAVGIWIGFMLGFSRAMREAAKKARPVNYQLIGRIVFGFACLTMMIAIGTGLYTWHFVHVAKHTNGKVVELLQSRDKNSGDITYAPTFSFRDTNGTQYTVSSSLYTSPPQVHPGDSIEVLYLENHPQTARINTYSQVWGLTILLLIVAFAELIAGLTLLRWSKVSAFFREQKESTLSA